MANIFGTLSTLINDSLNGAIAIVATANESIEVGTNYVHMRAVEQNLTDKQEVTLRTAKSLQAIDLELKQDKDLNEIFHKLQDAFA